MIQGVVKKGKVLGANVPSPKISEGCLLIQVKNSCISAGTEMSNVNVTKKSLIKRALDQPEELKTVIDFAKTNGIAKTIQRVRGVVEGGKQTGYSVSGVVVGIGKGVRGFEIGDHVAAAGAGIANHAEYVDVPMNLVMKMPKGMPFDLASTVTLGGIAMQGVRRIDLKLGEICVVVGAGILGLIALQMLKLSGVKVAVSDYDEKRLALAKEFGADVVLNPAKDNLLNEINVFSGGYGADGVLFTAATSSSAPLSESFKMCRKKGKVVLVGVVGMEINRGDIYAKELDFLISTSYGPGRYDTNYEEKGLDYPYAYVRWTENRNMASYLSLVNEGKITIRPMIDSVFPIDQIEKAFESLQVQDERPIIVLLDYKGENKPDRKLELKASTHKKAVINVGIVGAGAFAVGMHLPNLKKLSDKFHIRAIMSRSGFKAKNVATQFGADYSTTDEQEIFNDKEIDLVMITSRHNTHGEYVLASLKAGKHTFVEKPLAINKEELNLIEGFYKNGGENLPVLMTGFNRRFSKIVQEVRRHTDKRHNPMMIHYRMNAGYIPYDHWVHDDEGRIVGEGCHIVDLISSLTQSNLLELSVNKLTPNTDKYQAVDNVNITLKYEDGSVGNIQYFSNGSKKIAKEYMEVHFDEKSIIMEDYKQLEGFGVAVKSFKERMASKGQYEELEVLHKVITEGKEWPISLEDMVQTTAATFLV